MFSSIAGVKITNSKDNLKSHPNVIVLEPHGEIMNKMCGFLRGRIVNIDTTKSKGGWFNPLTGEFGSYDDKTKNVDSLIEKLNTKSEEALKNKNYGKAYRLLSKVKKLNK